jgi:branched-chain amino acid transport system ATP-binding protein
MLHLHSVSKTFAGFAALTDVDLAIAPGEIRAIIGANGAGKSTLLNIISGVLHPSAGTVSYDGHDVTSRLPCDLVMLGLSRSFQITSIFNEFSVFENVRFALLAFHRLTRGMFSSVDRLVRPETMALLDAVGIADLAERPAEELAAGDRKRLEFAMALAARPELLLLDEPTAGMAPRERDIVINLLSSLNHDKRVTILFTEHDLDMVSRLAHTITVLHQGRVLAEGKIDEIKANEMVRAAYIGGL